MRNLNRFYSMSLTHKPVCDIYRQYGKRALDLCITIPSLIVLAPILLIVSFMVRVDIGSPVLFAQARPGLYGKSFMLYKFRTMTDATDRAGNLLPDHQRLTHLGKFLRKTSLDELPELFNVLRGDMSLVGPRPLLERYLPYYTHLERTRHDVLPGITGWAQIQGRNNASWDDRLAMDVWYVDNRCLELDAAILVQTVVSVVKREDVNVLPTDSMDDFDVERQKKAKAIRDDQN